MTNDSKKPTDLPIGEILEMVKPMIMQGDIIYQKFTCSNCGQRLTMDEPNKIFMKGTCDKCGKTSHIRECGFMRIRSYGEDMPEGFFEELFKE